MIRGSTLVILASYFAVSSALWCWKCRSLETNDCQINGDFEECTGGDQGTCQTEVRIVNGKTLIDTGCKQENACSDNQDQNLREAWYPTQCNTRQGSVCRCCCYDDKCNKRMARNGCRKPSNTPTSPPRTCGIYPEKPVHGTKQCYGNLAPSLMCIFKCNKGYKLVGYTSTVCRLFGQNEYGWDNPTPTCEEEEICDPEPSTPENGYMLCNATKAIGSRCDFLCKHGYKRHGSSFVTCERTEFGVAWTPQLPTCEPGKRRNIPISPPRTCGIYPEKPVHGTKQCIGNSAPRSMCIFKCNKGYKLVGYTSTVCRLFGRNEYRWDNPTPTCEEEETLVCDPLPPNVPVNGNHECWPTGSRELATDCYFSCNNGYDLIGHYNTVCGTWRIRTKAEWSNPIPTCKKVQCEFVPTPRNAEKECTSGRDLGSVCSFSCKHGFEMKGLSDTNCVRDTSKVEKAKWDQETPTCEPVCDMLPKGPKDGSVTCEGHRVGDKCTYRCTAGFEMRGSETTECISSGEGAQWSNNRPICEYVPPCGPTPSEPINGYSKCIGGREFGAKCDFVCNEGYDLIGYDYTICERMVMSEKRRGKWSNPTPTCEKVRCAEIPNPSNGKTSCTFNRNLGSVCSFMCNKNYQLNGDSSTTCRKDLTENATPGVGKWDREVPTCEPPRPSCRKIKEYDDIDVTCDKNTHVVGTTCKFQCKSEGLTLLPNTTESECQGNLKWSPKPRCCVDCSKIKRDIVIALDVSDSVTDEQFVNMTEFLKKIIEEFKYGADASLFSIFQFGSGAQGSKKMRFDKTKSQDKMLRQLGRMKRRGLGGDTMTGEALLYAQNRLRDPGNRKGVPDMLFLLTDGLVHRNDKKNMIDRADALRKAGVEILALGIGSDDTFKNEMTEVTGDKNKVIMEDSVDKLTANVAKNLLAKTCQDEKECDRR